MSWPLLGLTRATEDEYCARSEHAFLFACFQQQRYFRQSEDRWNELARTAETVVVFVDFTATAGAAPAPRQVPVPAGAPLGREWVVVCEAPGYPGYPVCLAGWEFPGRCETPLSPAPAWRNRLAPA